MDTDALDGVPLDASRLEAPGRDIHGEHCTVREFVKAKAKWHITLKGGSEAEGKSMLVPESMLCLSHCLLPKSVAMRKKLVAANMRCEYRAPGGGLEGGSHASKQRVATARPQPTPRKPAFTTSKSGTLRHVHTAVPRRLSEAVARADDGAGGTRSWIAPLRDPLLRHWIVPVRNVSVHVA